MRPIVVLADSRGLDTYYLNADYSYGYGVDKVFASVLGRMCQALPEPRAEVLLIPDHFRGGTPESNIMRVSLCNPGWVILCDGIWETLLNRPKYFEEARNLGNLGTEIPDPEPGERDEHAGNILNQLYFDEKLSVSPSKYAEDLEKIVSYFRRRRRGVAWLSLLVPGPDHLDGVHYAGNYRPLPGWDNRLRAINSVAQSVLERWGGVYVDIAPLASTIGGFGEALIDQWHFTPSMHSIVADHLFRILCSDDHVSDGFSAPLESDDVIIPNRYSGTAKHVHGSDVLSHIGRLKDLRNCLLVVDEDPRLGEINLNELFNLVDESVLIVTRSELTP